MSGLRFLWGAGLAAPALLFAAPAAAQDAAPTETVDTTAAPSPVDAAIAFAKAMTDKATAALLNPNASESEKLDAFQEVLSESLALDVIGKFMLGEHRKEMSDDQLARYNAIFPEYITRIYADQFKDIVGRPLEVLEAKAIGERDVIVRTQFERKDGDPITVDWRVRKLRSGDLKMIDIIVRGVSIMLVKREEFSSFIASNGIDPLIARLEKEAGAKPA